MDEHGENRLDALLNQIKRVRLGERVPHEVINITLTGKNAVLFRALKEITPLTTIESLYKCLELSIGDTCFGALKTMLENDKI